MAIESEKGNFYVFWKMKLRPHFDVSKKTFWVSSWRRNFPQKNVGKHFFITSNNYTLLQKDQGKRMQVSSFLKVIRCVWVAIESEKKNFTSFEKWSSRPHFGASKKTFWNSPWRWNFPHKNVGKHFFITFNNYKLLQKYQRNRLQVVLESYDTCGWL